MGRITKSTKSSTKTTVMAGRVGGKIAHGKSPRKGYEGGKAPKAPKKSKKNAAEGDAEGAAKERKKHRWHAGTVALREIRKFQKSTEPILRRAPFIRLVRSIAAEEDVELRFQAGALGLLQAALEKELTDTFHMSQLAAIHARRVTLSARDIRTSRMMLNEGPGKPLSKTPIPSSYANFAAPAVAAAVAKDKPAKPAKPAKADEPSAEEPNTEEADPVNPLVQAVAQELTIRDETQAPGTPSRRVPTTPSKKKAAEPVPQFDDNDMSVFA